MTTPNAFLNSLQKTSKKYQDSIDQTFRKNNGIYYTNVDLAVYLIDEMFELNPDLHNASVSEKTFLEPCVGIGVFVFAYLCKLNTFLSKDQMAKAINNIYAIDIDPNAINAFINNLKTFCTDVVGIQFDAQSYKEKNTSCNLMFSQRNTTFRYYSLSDSLPFYSNRFDIVVTNPPYKNLKAEMDKFQSKAEYQKEKEYYSQISLFSKKEFKYSADGVLNIYKLFVEKIVDEYSSDDSNIVLLIPTTILTDKSCTKLRKLISKVGSYQSINCIEENNKIFDGTQALSSLLIKKGEFKTSFRIDNHFEINAKHEYKTISYENSDTDNNEIVVLSESDSLNLSLLSRHKRLRELNFITNKRGELDMTANSSSIVDYETPYVLLRGKNIGEYFLKSEPLAYASISFVEKSTKRQYILSPRIACQQISNMGKDKRLIFSFVPKNFVLGNSCNFIGCSENKYSIDIFYLLGILNCSVMNWFFKLKSSNNHVNNYEIDEFPIPTKPKSKIERISKLVREVLERNVLSNIEIIDKKCNELLLGPALDDDCKEGEYMNNSEKSLLERFKDDASLLLGEKLSNDKAKNLLDCDLKSGALKLILTPPSDELRSKALNGLIEKYQKMQKYKLLTHITYKLSDLDLEMIACVPQGGNWKDIKPEIIQKSQRLVRIAQTGGRTTLYGRIDYSKPAYTITTYFNRPGNGTYVHPVHERVISVREAARIQSFDDDYFFYGSKSDYLDQIGNAVPPLLAKAIATKIVEKVGVKHSLDLFVGAGGLTSGFEQAGVNSICGCDIVLNACVTLKINNPHIDVICGDLTLQETKDKIYKSIEKNRVDLICGGPPCQGFSMAGKRFVDDPRNKLFKEYLDILKHVMPKVFVMENVDGMKSMQQGKVYNEIINSFTEAGYKVEGRLLLANEYGVPQKRKRLIIIGIRNDISIAPEELYPDKIDTIVTAFDAISDLETVPCSADATYDDTVKQSLYVKHLRRKMP